MRETIPDMAITLTGDRLTIEDLVGVARRRERVELGDGVADRVRAGSAIVDARAGGGQLIYGLTTGVGVRKRTRVELGARGVQQALDPRASRRPGRSGA